MGDTLRAKLMYGIDNETYPDLFEHIQKQRDDPDPDASDYDEDVEVPFSLIRSDLQKKYDIELLNMNDGEVQIVAAHIARAVGRTFAFEELGNEIFSTTSIMIYTKAFREFLEAIGAEKPERYYLQWYLIGENN